LNGAGTALSKLDRVFVVCLPLSLSSSSTCHTNYLT